MPIYDYYCEKCDKTFDVYGKGTPALPCPDCGTNSEKQFPMPGSYSIKGDNSASTRPKGGAFKKTK